MVWVTKIMSWCCHWCSPPWNLLLQLHNVLTVCHFWCDSCMLEHEFFPHHPCILTVLHGRQNCCITASMSAVCSISGKNPLSLNVIWSLFSLQAMNALRNFCGSKASPKSHWLQTYLHMFKSWCAVNTTWAFCHQWHCCQPHGLVHFDSMCGRSHSYY